MPFKQVTEQDLKGKGVIGQPAVPGLSVTEMQKSVEQVVREAAIPAHNQLCEQLEAEAAAADIGAAVPGQGDMPPETPKKLQSVLEAMLAWAKEKLGLKADKASTYTKQQVDEAINEKVAAIGAGDMTMAVYDPESKKKPYMPAEEAMAKAVYDPQGEGVVAQAAQAQSAACAAQAVAVQAYVPPQETPQPGGEGAQQEAGAAALAQAPAQAAAAGQTFGGPVRLSVDEATGAVTLHAVKQGLGEEGEPVGEAAVEEVPVANAAALGGKTEAELSVGDSAKIGGKVLSMSLSGTTLTIHYT
ncbi:MAG TPA: hypothetical protein H9998_09950 [Candidatus Ruthenibacterium merdipullorum]|nr:hypothetical protein [Candidatus Ruthenibacterium merdipullorum]